MKTNLSIIILLLLLVGFFACTENGTTSKNSGNTPPIDTASLVNTMGSPLIEELSKKIEQSPDNPVLYASRGELYYSKENYPAAIKDLNSSIALDSTNPAFFHLLSDAYMDNFQSEKALEVLSGFTDRNPKSIPSMLKLSEFQMILKQHDASLETIEKILTVSSRHPEGFYMLGMNFKAMGDTARAINSFQTTVEEDADHIDGYVQLGVLLDRLKKPIALKYFNNALQVDSTNLDALFGKAWYYHQRNKFNLASEWYEKAANFYPKESKIHVNNGILNLEMSELNKNEPLRIKQLAKAFSRFDLATKVDPGFGTAYYYRGLTLEMQGKPKKAIKDYRQAAALMREPLKANKALIALGQKPIIK